jgi:hypothetical protein
MNLMGALVVAAVVLLLGLFATTDEDRLPLRLERSPTLPPSVSINLSVSGSKRKSPFFRIGLFRRSHGLVTLSNDDLLPKKC